MMRFWRCVFGALGFAFGLVLPTILGSSGWPLIGFVVNLALFLISAGLLSWACGRKSRFYEPLSCLEGFFAGALVGSLIPLILG
jgi:hypothetical protein